MTARASITALAAVLCLVCAPAQAEYKSIVGKPYWTARLNLMSAGWEPMKLSKEECGDRDLCEIYEEAYSCAGTGKAPCAMLFERNGETLKVVTVGEQNPTVDLIELQ